MVTEKITDPVLGDEGRLFGGAEPGWVSFKKEFAPTKARVLILASFVNGSVPQAERDLYREIEAWYPQGVYEAYEAILRKVRENPAATELTSLEEIQNRLQLIKIDIRIPLPRPATCVLIYRFDPNAPVWYVRIGEDYHVEWCGLGD
ncbi:MAG: hypothetical protein A2W36_06820 [Chloroflexi bacterium RBG_16_58_14]|nr:MAG: hypothetical protein A2W36_06820 [Chloroflexi bacterium RBG_16_58_14]